ncbi:MAG: ferritin-like domain-containing protein [Verrucomicrobiota bacterium]
MNAKYNIDEIFEIAIKIEENGAAFYRKAASLQEDDETAGVLRDLAGMEEDHKANFQNMRAAANTEATVETEFDPYLESLTYLNATADAHGGEGSVSQTAALTGNESLEDILQTGIGLEKESILFYMGIRDNMAAGTDIGKLNEIISEEKNHLATLAALRKKLA